MKSAGIGLAEDKDSNFWIENTGDEPAEFIGLPAYESSSPWEFIGFVLPKRMPCPRSKFLMSMTCILATDAVFNCESQTLAGERAYGVEAYQNIIIKVHQAS